MRTKKKPGSQNIPAEESMYLFSAPSQISGAGKGLYTAVTIYKDEIIAQFRGEFLSNAEVIRRVSRGKSAYFITMPDGTILDCMRVAGFAKYANDPQGFVKTRFKPNCDIMLDDEDNVCLIAQKNIKTGQEIFCNYGKRYWKQFEKEHL